jgi:hypothetical protein
MQVRDAAGAGLLTVPAPERNQGFGLSCRGDGGSAGKAGLAGGEWEVRGETRFHFSTGITSVVPSTQASPLLLD